MGFPDLVPNFYHVAVDGSAFDHLNKYGIGGIVIRPNEDEPSGEFSRRIEGKQTSFTTEIHAAAYALSPEIIGDTNQKIVIHSDNRAVCGLIKECWQMAKGKGRNGYSRVDEFIERNAHRDRSLRQALAQLFCAVSAHEQVHVEWNKRSDAIMRMPHKLAQQGAKSIKWSHHPYADEGQSAEALEELLDTDEAAGRPKRREGLRMAPAEHYSTRPQLIERVLEGLGFGTALPTPVAIPA